MPRPATGGTEFGEHAISKPRRPRWTPSEDAKALLEKVFSADSFPTFAVRSQLAEQLSIDSRQVQIWFQNRRQRERLKTGSHATALTEADEEVDDIPTGAGWQEVVPPRVALLGSLDDGVPSSRLGQSDTQTTWDAQDAGARTPLLATRPCACAPLLTPLSGAVWRRCDEAGRHVPVRRDAGLQRAGSRLWSRPGGSRSGLSAQRWQRRDIAHQPRPPRRTELADVAAPHLLSRPRHAGNRGRSSRWLRQHVVLGRAAGRCTGGANSGAPWRRHSGSAERRAARAAADV